MSIRFEPDRPSRSDEFDIEFLYRAAATIRNALPRLINHWFVEYNPLYFFSGLCVLVGVFLVSRGVGRLGIEHGELILTGVEQAYQFALIGAAALLYRVAGKKRPAVILGLLESLFIFDWTLRYAAMAPVSGYGLACSIAMAVMVPVKILLLLRIFGIRRGFMIVGLPTACIAAVAFAPHLLLYADEHQASVHLLATWVFAAIFSAHSLVMPRLEPRYGVGAFGSVVLQRCATAAWVCTGVFCGVHLVSQMVQFNIEPTLSHGAPAVIAAAFAAGLRREIWVWATAAAAVGMAMSWPATAAPTAAAVGIGLLAWAALRSMPRIYVAGALAGWFGILMIGWTGGSVPSPDVAPNAAATVILFGLAFLMRMPSSAAAGIALWIPFSGFLVPKNELDGGILAISAGFLALVAAVGISWAKRGKGDSDAGPVMGDHVGSGPEIE